MNFSANVNDYHLVLTQQGWIYDNGWEYNERSWSAYVHNRIRSSQGNVVLLVGDYDTLNLAFSYVALYYPEMDPPAEISVGMLGSPTDAEQIAERIISFLQDNRLWPHADGA